MNKENLKLVWVALGALMLVLLQTEMFQNSIGFLNIIGIYYLGDIVFKLTYLLSFIGVIVFIIVSFKLIFNNIKGK